MANICEFYMKVKGQKESVETFYKIISRSSNIYKNRVLGRVYEVYKEDEYFMGQNGAGDYAMILSGECAWSVCTSILYKKGDKSGLDFESKALGLVIEVFSREPGMGFEEHYIIDNGDIILEECEDMIEIFLEYYCAEKNCGLGQAIQQINVVYQDQRIRYEEGDYYVYIGGVDNYGVFTI